MPGWMKTAAKQKDDRLKAGEERAPGPFRAMGVRNKMQAKFYTLGCKVNQYESEAMRKLLEEHGIGQAEEGQSAQVAVVNSCTVTAQSDQKVRQLLRRARRENPGAVVVLTGCMVQAFPEQAQELQEADILLGTSNRRRLPEHIFEFLRTGNKIVDIAPHPQGEAFEKMSVAGLRERTRAFLKIEDGCNRFCSYCIIPYARGRVRSKPLEELKNEVALLAENGYREVVLTGINLSCYGQELGLTLCDAVEAACGVPGILRVRLGSLEPELLFPETIERLSKQPKLCPQFHLSLQSGCNATLRRMNRHYTAEEYAIIVEGLRGAFENAAITTDLMVGFPGETEEEFRESLAFAERIAFARAHVFAYSRRPGTRACEMEGQVPNRIKEERSRRMIRAAAASQEAFCRSQIGRREEVLIERRSEREKGLCEGHTANYTPVLVPLAENRRGELLPVEITGAEGGYCFGKVTKNEAKDENNS